MTAGAVRRPDARAAVLVAALLVCATVVPFAGLVLVAVSRSIRQHRVLTAVLLVMAALQAYLLGSALFAEHLDDTFVVQ